MNTKVIILFFSRVHRDLDYDYYKGELYLDINGWDPKDYGDEHKEIINTNMTLRGFELRVPTKEN